MRNNAVRSSKAVAVMLVLMMILMTAAPMIGASPSLASSGGSRASGRGSQNMTLYLQNTTTSHYVFDYSTTYIFDTNVGNRSNFFGDTHTVTFSWDISPMLAGDLAVNGDVVVWMYMNTVGVPVNGNLQFTLYDISYKKDAITQTVAWSTASGNTQVQVQSGVILYSVTIPAVNHVFPAGHDIGLLFQISGGASAYYGMWYGNATYDSRIEFQTASHMLVNESYTLDYWDQPRVNFELNLSKKIVKIRSNITDPFGGYDINTVKLTLRDSLGAIVLNNVTMVRIIGNPNSFATVFEYQWNYTGAAEGKYNATIWAVDNNGYNYYHHRAQYNYGVYWKVGFVDFWIGGLPANYHVKVLDSKGLPLAGATVTADRGGRLVKNVTDADGVAGMAVFPTLYTFKVYWQEVEVAVQQVTVVDKGTVTITAAVYYPTIKVLDANGAPLKGSSVFEVHPNGTVFLSPWITDTNGTFAIDRAPGGSYNFIVKWRDVEVANVVVAIASNGVYTINAKVFTLNVTAHDSHGKPLGGAQVVITEVTTHIVFDSKLTDLKGTISTQQPNGSFNIDVYWAETDVGGLAGYNLTANAAVTINCTVFYVTIKAVDSRSVPVSDVQVLVLSNMTGSLIDSGRTGDKGLATLRLPMGSHRYQAFWKDIMVANGSGLAVTGDIPDTSPYIITIQVFYAAIKVVDSRGFPLPSAQVTVTAQAGGVFDFQQTDANGMVTERVPLGTHIILVQWKGVDVARVTNFAVSKDIPASAPFVVTATVYYMTVVIRDSKTIGVPGATINIFHQNGEVADAGLTGATGNVTIRLPKSVYDIKVAWKDIEVGGLDNHTLNGDELLTIDVAVYYVTFKVIDSKDVPVDLVHVTVYYGSGAVFDSGITDGSGEVRMRLARSVYDVRATWKDVEVGFLNDNNVTGDATITMKVAVYYVTFSAVDSRNLPVEKAHITAYYLSGSVMDSGTTEEAGVVVMRLPGAKVNVTVVWKGTLVYGPDQYNIIVTGTKVLNLKVYYLTVQVKGVGGVKVPKAVVTVTSENGATYDAGKTDNNGKVEFRVAVGTYIVSVRFTTTYYMSPVDEREQKPVTMNGDQLLVFTLTTYPQPMYTTGAFGLGMLIVLLLVALLIIYIVLTRKLKQSLEASLIRKEAREEAQAKVVEEKKDVATTKPSEVEKHELPPKETPKEAPKAPLKESPKETSKEPPKEMPKEPPKEMPKEPPKADVNPPKDVDKEIDNILDGLDKKT